MNWSNVAVADLVGRARNGDVQAWTVLVDEFQDVAVGLAAGWTGDWTAAADIAQDAFVSAFLHLDDLRDPQAFPAWFKQVVRTATTRHLRRVAGSPSRNATSPTDPAGDPIDTVASADDAQRLHLAIESLPEHERAVIALHYLAGFPYAKVAELLGISVSAAKKRAFSARLHLKEQLETAVDTLSAARPSRSPRLRDTVALFLAIRRRDHDLVRGLLAKSPELVSATEVWTQEEAMRLGLQNAEHGTPLVRAVQTGDAELVQLVLDAGASPRQACGCAGAETALWAAALLGETKIAAALLAAGADPNAAAFASATPLIVAAQRGHHEITELLLAAGADPTLRDAAGRTAEDWSTSRGGPEPRRRDLLATGIRALDLFAPIRPGSTQWWPAAWELGQFALLTELIRAIAPAEFWQIGFATGPYDEESGRQWHRQFPVATELLLTPETAGATARREHFEAAVRTVSRSPADKIVMVLTGPGHHHDVTVAVARFVDDPAVLTTIVIEPATGPPNPKTPPPHPPEGFDAQVSFDPGRAGQGLWPAVDALHTTVTAYPSPRHHRLAEAARALLERYRAVDPGLAMPEPTRHRDPALAASAQALHRYLAQPFTLWEHQSARPGESTPYDRLLDEVETLLARRFLP